MLNITEEAILTGEQKKAGLSIRSNNDTVTLFKGNEPINSFSIHDAVNKVREKANKFM